MDKSRIAASVLLLGLGIGALVVVLGRPAPSRDPVDLATAALTVALALAVLVSRRALIPAAAWAILAAVAGALQLVPPYEPSVGDVTFYLGRGLTGRHWNATGGYALTALGYGAAVLALGWSMGRSVGVDAPHAWWRWSRLAAAIFALLAAGALLGALIVGTSFLAMMSGMLEHLAVMWIGALVTGRVAWWAWNGRRPEAVAGWAALMFATSTLWIVGAVGTDPLPGTVLAGLLTAPLLGPIELVSRYFPDVLGLAARWLVAAAWLSISLLMIADRIVRRGPRLGEHSPRGRSAAEARGRVDPIGVLHHAGRPSVESRGR